MITYEYPFNERVRTYLRLEHLFDRVFSLIEDTEVIEHHFALTTLFEIMDVGARADLKSDVMKDLERQKQAMMGYRGNPSIAAEALEDVIERLQRCFDGLNAIPGRAGQSLTEIDWLMGVRSRAAIPGGTCEFDLPAYFAWKHLPAARRQQDLRNWIHTLRPLAASVRLLLNLLRQSGAAQKVSVVGGQYQQSLQQGRTSQLVRVALEREAELIPEISGNRLVVSIRLMRLGDDSRLHASGEDATLEITLCA